MKYSSYSESKRKYNPINFSARFRTMLNRVTRHFVPYVYKNICKFSLKNSQAMESTVYEETSGARRSYWIDSAPKRPQTLKLASDLSVDTCVIGAGIAGLTTAYFLAKQGHKVVVLEDGEVCSGETGRTTGYLTWVIDDGITNIINYFGLDGAKLHVDSHRTAVDMVEQISKGEGIDCEFRRVPGYWFSHKPKKEQDGQPDKEVMEEYDAMLKVGMKDISIVNKPPYAEDDGKCIRIPRQGQFHSVAYCFGLADRIIGAGGSIHTLSKVVDWKGGKQPWAKTADGHTVKCNSLVMATNIPLQMLTTIAKLENQRSYVVGGKVPKGKYEWCIFQDDSMRHHKPYKYGRFTSLDANYDMLFVGGEDHLVGFETDFEERYRALEKWASERYPDIKFDYRWSGQIQEPADFIAYIGLDPGTENVYIVTGDSGLGITHGTLGGKLISDMILDIPNPWKTLYDPKRLKMKAMPEVLKHLAEVNLQFKDYFKGGDVTDIEDIIPGEGGVVCKGINRYAVYKDENGKVTACSAVCQHMKGLVRWNSSEKSWDCPIHGSRYDKFGKVLNGPALKDLPKVPVEEISEKVESKKTPTFK
jgi:glycine/D-amino acid oxidase-like deaminating enzyme/nitrite reductase/ring-hydroxylating ferredoxin subunit